MGGQEVLVSREVACLGSGLVQLNHCPFLNNFLPLSSWSPNPQQQPCPLGEQAGVCVRQVSLPVGRWSHTGQWLTAPP